MSIFYGMSSKLFHLIKIKFCSFICLFQLSKWSGLIYQSKDNDWLFWKIIRKLKEMNVNVVFRFIMLRTLRRDHPIHHQQQLQGPVLVSLCTNNFMFGLTLKVLEFFATYPGSKQSFAWKNVFCCLFVKMPHKVIRLDYFWSKEDHLQVSKKNLFSSWLDKKSLSLFFVLRLFTRISQQKISI